MYWQREKVDESSWYSDLKYVYLWTHMKKCIWRILRYPEEGRLGGIGANLSMIAKHCTNMISWTVLTKKCLLSGIPEPEVGIDIDLNVGDIRHLTLTSVIPISETNMSDWKLSFRYRKCSDIDIRVHSDIRHLQKILIYQLDSYLLPLELKASTLPLSYDRSP